jgi:DNA repair ATPase RecN
MIRKIILENFMSHKRTVIEPADGLTLITGENNCGKSAIAVALEAVSGHTMGNFMLRHGEKKAKVILELDNEDGAHTIEWNRSKNSQGWSVDDLEDSRGKPEILDAVLRLPQVESETSSNKYQLHIADQKDPIFLLDETGSRAAEFFAASGDAVHLFSMRQLQKKKVRDRTTESGLLRRQIEANEADLKKLEPVEDIRKAVDIAKLREVELVRLEKDQLQLEQHLKLRRRTLTETLKKEKRSTQLKLLNAEPNLQDTRALSTAIQNLDGAKKKLERLSRKRSCTKSVAAPPEQTATKTLTEFLYNLIAKQAVMDATKARGYLLASLRDQPTMTTTDKRSAMVNALTVATKTVHQASTSRNEAGRKLEDVKKQFQALEDQGATCTHCGAPLNYEHLTKDVHAPMQNQ